MSIFVFVSNLRVFDKAAARKFNEKLANVCTSVSLRTLACVLASAHGVHSHATTRTDTDVYLHTFMHTCMLR